MSDPKLTNALFDLIREMTDEPAWSAVVIAEKIAASDSLAAHDAEVRRAALEEVQQKADTLYLRSGYTVMTRDMLTRVLALINPKEEESR